VCTKEPSCYIPFGNVWRRVREEPYLPIAQRYRMRALPSPAIPLKAGQQDSYSRSVNAAPGVSRKHVLAFSLSYLSFIVHESGPKLRPRIQLTAPSFVRLRAAAKAWPTKKCLQLVVTRFQFLHCSLTQHYPLTARSETWRGIDKGTRWCLIGYEGEGYDFAERSAVGVA
jgi:hypothetical protein